MGFRDAEFGTADHFFAGMLHVYDPLIAMSIRSELEKYAGATRGRQLNKWQLSYLAEELTKMYPGFDLYVIGYFGDGDAELRF